MPSAFTVVGNFENYTLGEIVELESIISMKIGENRQNRK